MKEQKEILERQLQWTKKQIEVLDDMDEKLQAMKKIAEYVAENDLSKEEVEKLNSQLKELQTEYSFLEAQRKTDFH
ncbi:hypothetical protein BN1080_03381 [Planococcus massiliensis]|uniref:Uncharacterized protein n=1 Tax=Planococcus massiliensis TaxID=1499687 RepID=A0A098EPY9_9BACL|nr:hypothetical protein [Planococcus massiliensis]CEG24358.1 hypothetical protein BN1080_03381 [Planococcus massiliensis]